MLIGWCCFAAVVLIVSLVVHLSTFLGIDPMARWPGVMFIHVTIFPPFIAAICYANRIGGPEQERQNRAISAAPLLLRIVTGIFFAYALVNFAIFMVLNEGGGPEQRGGKYLLTSHGRVIRELSENEYYRQQGYVVRGFSGHWMLFSSAALTLLVGAARLRRQAVTSPAAAMTAPAAVEGKSGPTTPAADQPPAPGSVRAGCLALVFYALCLGLILSGQPALAVVAALPLAIGTVLAVRRRGFPHNPFESYLGCLAAVPNVLIASFMAKRAVEFVYVAIYVGLRAALTHEVAVTFPTEGPSQLSNGELLDNKVWSALMVFVQFPLFAIGTLGLTYLAEHVGRLVEVRRRARNDHTRP